MLGTLVAVVFLWKPRKSTDYWQSLQAALATQQTPSNVIVMPRMVGDGYFDKWMY